MADNDTLDSTLLSGSPDTSAAPTTAPAPTPAPAAQPPAAAPAPDATTQRPPSKWEMILTGALRGLAGASGAKTFAQGLSGGAQASLAGAQQDKENAMAQQEHDLKIKFMTAQAASMAADAAIKDKQLHSMDQKDQDAHIANALDQLKAMQGLGLQPTLVVDNHTNGAITGMQQLTASHGAVPPLFTINLGDKIVGFDLNQLSQAPQALDQVNKIRALQGQQPFDPKTWAQAPQELKNAQTDAAFSFWNPLPSEQGLQVYKNYLNTAQAAPDSPDKQANVARLQAVVNGMQSSLDNANARSNKQAATKAGIEANARVQAENSPAAIAGAAAKAGAEQKARNQADLQAMNGNVDAFGSKIGITPEGTQLAPKEYNSRSDKFAKDYVAPLNVLQKTNMEFERINNNPNQTGAEKVTALLNAVGISGDPLKGKGFRISNDVINEHAQARNIWQGAVQKLNTIVGSGGPITSQQIKDYTEVAQGVVHDAYVTAAQEARRQGLPVNFLPKATSQGQKAPDSILKIYVDSAGGDVGSAEKALRQAGWQ